LHAVSIGKPSKFLDGSFFKNQISVFRTSPLYIADSNGQKTLKHGTAVTYTEDMMFYSQAYNYTER